MQALSVTSLNSELIELIKEASAFAPQLEELQKECVADILSRLYQQKGSDAAWDLYKRLKAALPYLGYGSIKADKLAWVKLHEAAIAVWPERPELYTHYLKDIVKSSLSTSGENKTELTRELFGNVIKKAAGTLKNSLDIEAVFQKAALVATEAHFDDRQLQIDILRLAHECLGSEQALSLFNSMIITERELQMYSDSRKSDRACPAFEAALELWPTKTQLYFQFAEMIVNNRLSKYKYYQIKVADWREFSLEIIENGLKVAEPDDPVVEKSFLSLAKKIMDESASITLMSMSKKHLSDKCNRELFEIIKKNVPL